MCEALNSKGDALSQSVKMSLRDCEAMEINTAPGRTQQKRNTHKYLWIGADVHFVSLLCSMSSQIVYMQLFRLTLFFEFVCENARLRVWTVFGRGVGCGWGCSCLAMLARRERSAETKDQRCRGRCNPTLWICFLSLVIFSGLIC